MPRSYFPTPTSPKHKKMMQEKYKESSSFKNYSSAYRTYEDNAGSVSTTSVSTSTKSYDQNAFDPWKEPRGEFGSPFSVLDGKKLNREPVRTGARPTVENPKLTQPRASNAKRPPSNRIIPGVSKMNMRQTLVIIFAAYWDRADLYMDVLGLENDHPSVRELKLAFFQQGREVIATPIESPDDATMLTYGRAPFLKESGAGSTISVVQRGVPVSRKAKLKFQAIGLAYELLSDPSKRSIYDKWRLFNGRLPEPKKISRSVRASANERIRMQEATESPSSFAMHNVRSPMMESINENEMDGFPEEQERSMRRTYKFSDSNHSNVQSILRKSARMRARQSLTDASTNSRKISWNEEVEELTLMQENSEDPFPADAPFVSINEKQNSRNITDPYGKSAEDWFGDVDNAWSKSVENAFPQKKKSTRSKKPPETHGNNFTESDHDDMQENKIQSLNSNVHIAGFGRNLDDCYDYNDEPDDSFLVIMNGPWEGDNQQQRQKRGVHPKTSDKLERLDDEWTRFDNETLSPTSSQFSSEKVSKQTSKNDKKNDQDTPLCTGTPKRKSKSSNRMHESSIGPSNQVPLTNIPFDPNDEDASLLTNDFTNSLTSNPTSEDDFNAEYDSNDCNGIGHTVDIARGFQASLSKYISAAVEDMKEGLAIVGQNWDDLDKPDVPRKENKNFFTLEGFELDAMMGILKTEMDRFNDQFVCGAPDDAEYVNSSRSQNSIPLSKDKSFGNARGTTVFKAKPFTQPKKGIRKRLARIFSRKSKS